jgi:gamma-tubulin complex component 2
LFISQKEAEIATSETFSEKVSRFDTQFTQQIVALLTKLHEFAEKENSDKFVSLIHRINFNNFYSDKLVSHH